jgi:hypothetical protein
MDTTVVDVPTIPGTPFAGGFFVARYLIGTEIYALVVSPKAEGELKDTKWSRIVLQGVDGAQSFFDGLANTEAMISAVDSDAASWTRELRIGDFGDWYIPSRDELELCYRAFKPGTEENFCGSGDNPSALPATWPYSRTTPAQTSVEAFKAGGAEAFEETWYWTSTQYAGLESSAWCQLFYTGSQYYHHKANELRARAVRRVKI